MNWVCCIKFNPQKINIAPRKTILPLDTFGKVSFRRRAFKLRGCTSDGFQGNFLGMPGNSKVKILKHNYTVWLWCMYRYISWSITWILIFIKYIYLYILYLSYLWPLLPQQWFSGKLVSRINHPNHFEIQWCTEDWRKNRQMSYAQNPYNFPFYSLVNRDLYNGLI